LQNLKNLENKFMIFRISYLNRLLIIIGASYLIISYFIVGFSFLYSDDFGHKSVIFSVDEAIRTIFSVVIYYNFAKYFEFYKLKLLSIITWLRLASIVFIGLISIVDLYVNKSLVLYRSVFITLNVLAIILWIVLVLRIERGKFIGLRSLVNYSHAYIYSVLLAVSIGLLLMFLESSKYDSLIYIANILPNFFVIDFAKKIYKTI